MAVSSKVLRDSKYGFIANRKKIGINIWRFIFNGIDKVSGTESMFFIELELLNSYIPSPEPVLGFKPRIKITSEDLQYALAGTSSAQNIQSETIVQPSYVVIRVAKLGADSKHVCSYHSIKSLKVSQKPFSMLVGNKLFAEDKLSGFINITEDEYQKHPEYLCDKGYVTWNLNYEIQKDFSSGFKSKTDRWFPFGIRTAFSGTINFNGNDYIVDSKKSYGYMDRYWGKSMPDTWFHISSTDLTSIISGKKLFDSSFSVQGEFNKRISFVGNFEGSDVSFCADSSKRSYSTVWSCIQTPENDDENENKLHWSVSVNSKQWVIDIDLYCRINELNNRLLEMPEGDRKVLNVLYGGTGTGEIKLFKRDRKNLEQIEYAKITKTVCEFGHVEEGEI